MNAAKALNPNKRDSSRKSSQLKQMASQMGFKKEDFGGDEATALLQKLDDLAANDPEGYEAFIKEQMESHQQYQKSMKNTFLPSPVFALKTFLANTCDKVFINVCSFSKLDKAQDASGNVLEGTLANLPGINIPIAISPVRKVKDSKQRPALAIDAVLHTQVGALAERDHTFKVQLVDLVLQWAEQELPGGKTKLDRKYKLLVNRKYCGGGGALQQEVVPFPVPGAPKHEEEEVVDPQDLLSKLRKEKMSAENSSAEINLCTADPSPKEEKAASKVFGKKLIEEVRPAKKPAVKKGFLQKKNTVLYPEGSSEGGPKTLMDRAKIVDLSKMSPEEQQKAMEEHGKSQRDPVKNLEPKKEARNQQVEKKISKLEEEMRNNFLEVSKSQDDAFERLAMAADAEFGSSNVDKASGSSTLDAPAEDLFGMMARAMTGNQKPDRNASEKFPSKPKVQTPQHSFKTDKGLKKFSLKVELPGVASIQEAALDVSKTSLKLLVEGKFALDFVFPFEIDPASAIAKFSKSKQVLTFKA